jgi:hypothetical protein
MRDAKFFLGALILTLAFALPSFAERAADSQDLKKESRLSSTLHRLFPQSHETVKAIASTLKAEGIKSAKFARYGVSFYESELAGAAITIRAGVSGLSSRASAGLELHLRW